MDKIVKTLAPFGTMGIVFIIALTTAISTGLAGAAAFTSALAALGPGGLIGGLLTLGFVGLLTSVATQFGYDAIVLVVIKEQLKKRSKEEILLDISSKKLMSNDLKIKIKDYITRV